MRAPLPRRPRSKVPLVLSHKKLHCPPNPVPVTIRVPGMSSAREHLPGRHPSCAVCSQRGPTSRIVQIPPCLIAWRREPPRVAVPAQVHLVRRPPSKRARPCGVGGAWFASSSCVRTSGMRSGSGNRLWARRRCQPGALFGRRYRTVSLLRTRPLPDSRRLAAISNVCRIVNVGQDPHIDRG
jgi:hypothetical protein